MAPSNPIARLLLIGVLLAACGSPVDVADDGPGIVGDWELSGGTIDGHPFPMVDGRRITMNITEDTIGGVAACNSYGGSWVLDGTTLTVPEWSITEMGCEPEVTASQDAFLRVLMGAMVVSREATTLVLTTDDAELRFEPVLPPPTADLIGTDWALDGLVTGDAVSSVMGDPATLRLDDDGTFAASTGCRAVTGSWVQSGDSFRPTSMQAEGECPDTLRQQDSHVISVLEGPFTIRIEGDRLTITAPGNEGLTYRTTG